MKTTTNLGKRNFRLLFLIFLPFLLFSCKEEEKVKEGIVLSDENTINSSASTSDPANLVRIRTENMDIIMPDTLDAGWTTFRYTNDSDMVHLILFDKLPVVNGRQITIEDMDREVGPVFQNAMNLINQGKQEEGFAEFQKFPQWMGDVEYIGGIGLISPGETAETTLKLIPGHYVFECYVKTGGQFHNVMGMATEVVVTEEDSNANPPEADARVVLSGNRGIEIDGNIKAGPQIVEVTFEDQKTHENMVGHDLHLAKLESNTNMQELETWMDWVDPKGLETSTVPVRFLGGIQEMPAGNKAYVKLDLEPGRYAFISEVPNASQKNMLKVFTVPSN